MDDKLAEAFIETAEKIDRQLGAGRVAMLKQSYEFFISKGFSDEEIKSLMALTSHEMRLIKNK